MELICSLVLKAKKSKLFTAWWLYKFIRTYTKNKLLLPPSIKNFQYCKDVKSSLVEKDFACETLSYYKRSLCLWEISLSVESFLIVENFSIIGNFLDFGKFPWLSKISLLAKNFLGCEKSPWFRKINLLDLGRFPWLWKTSLNVRNFLDCGKLLYCGKLLFLYCPWSRQNIGLRLSKMKPYKKY